jgi:hypothetical protein
MQKMDGVSTIGYMDTTWELGGGVNGMARVMVIDNS